jgi:hypothetical protein
MNVQPDKKWLISLAIFLIIITTIPYLIGYFIEGSGWKFTGFLFGVEDGNSYIAKMLNGANGDWLFRTPYTAMEQAGFVAFLPFILLGKLTSQPGQHDQLVAIYHIFRWVGIFLFVFASYDFISLFLEKTSYKKAAVLIVTCGGGLGWLYFVGLQPLWGENLPLEFYSPESFGFLEIFGLPHLAVARALLLWGLVTYLRDPFSAWDRKKILIAGLIWFSIGFFQPLTISIGWLLISAHLAVGWIIQFVQKRTNKKTAIGEWKEYFRRGVIIAGSSFVWVLYNGIVFLNDPFAKIWMGQNYLPSPPVLSYLLAYVWMMPFVLIGIVDLIKKGKSQDIFLIIWVFLLPILAYAPVNVQRRLPEGYWLAIVIIAMIGLIKIAAERKKVLSLVVVPTFLSSLIFISGSTLTVLHPGLPAFIPRSEVDCYKKMNELIKSKDVVLASKITSNSLPAWANVRTLIGHGPESALKEEIEPQVDKFLKGLMTSQEQMKFLDEYRVKFLFWGINEQKIGDWNPASDRLLKLSYDGSGCRIYSNTNARQ